MMLTEVSSVAVAALPVQGLKDHLRLGTGFSDGAMQDGLVESYLRAAMAAIEGRTGKAILQRRFKLILSHWRTSEEQALPVAPVAEIVSVTLVAADGSTTLLQPAAYQLVSDFQRPKLAAVGYLLPDVPTDGRVEIVFDAGFGELWGDVPADLRQAVFLLAGQYYEQRNDFTGVPAGLPLPVQALIERWRTVRVLGGGAA
jgi:uncharacterized phiE125 gp8 family phage protein